MATISGDIDLMPVGELVLWLANRALTGTLSVRRRSCDSSFVVRGGMLWQASSTDPREFLGQHLINFGYIDEDQLQRAFDTQQETRVPLGRILVLVDAVTQDQLDRVLLFKTRESLLEAMSWAEGSFRFVNEDNSNRDIDTAQPVHLLDVHSEAVARASMWREIRNVFPSDATRVDVVGDPARLSGFDRKLVEVMRAGRSVGEASLELHAMDFQTYARLYDLYNRGVVRPRLASARGAAGSTPMAATPMPGPPGHFAAHAGGLVALAPPLPTPDRPVAPPMPAALPPAPGAGPPDAGSAARPSTATPRTAPAMPPSAAPSFAAPIPAPVPAPVPAHVPAHVAGHVPAYIAAQVPRAERPVEAPGVRVPAEAHDPHAAMRLALAGRNWSEAFLLAQRILELDPVDVEAISAWRVANAQLVKNRAPDDGTDLRVVPQLAMPREQVAIAHLTSKERYVLSRIDGRRSLQQIAAVSPIQKSELVRIVNAFVSRGVLEIKP